MEGCAEQWESIANQQREELEAVKAECDRLLEQVGLARPLSELAAGLLPNLDELRDRTLNSLKLGKQAPGYKAAAKALDRFIQDLNHDQNNQADGRQ